MKQAEYAMDKRAIAHRVVSLLIAFVLVAIDGLDGPGFIPLRILDGVYVFPLMMIWFPEALSDWADLRNGPKYTRVFGWILLLVVPLWFFGLEWLMKVEA